MSKPLITIQCGNYSNYLGSHFWNIQESGFVYQQGQSNHLRGMKYLRMIMMLSTEKGHLIRRLLNNDI